MRIVAISDTHGMHHRMFHPIPDGDVLIHCGDMTGHGSLPEVSAVARWLGDQPHKHKIAIAGNHDGACESDAGVVSMFFRECGVLYLCDNAVELDGVKFWGAPWTPNFCDWYFMPKRNSPELKAKWDLIPDDTQVLITHGPPHGILDAYVEPRYIERAGAEHVGCELLRLRVAQLPILRIHVFGHIHEGYGSERARFGSRQQSGDAGLVTFVNAATCNRDYRPVNPPQVVDL